MINIKDFNSNLLKIDRKPYKDFDIYYIGYITIKKLNKFNDYENIHSVNPLYLLIHSATRYFEEKNSEKYLFFDPIDKYEEVFSGIKLLIVKNYLMKSIIGKLVLILMIMYH